MSVSFSIYHLSIVGYRQKIGSGLRAVSLPLWCKPFPDSTFRQTHLTAFETLQIPVYQGQLDVQVHQYPTFKNDFIFRGAGAGTAACIQPQFAKWEQTGDIITTPDSLSSFSSLVKDSILMLSLFPHFSPYVPLCSMISCPISVGLFTKLCSFKCAP